MDAAFLSRFAAKIAWGYDEDMERALCPNKAWANKVIAYRHAAVKQGLQVIMDPRKTYDGAAYLAAGVSEAEVEEMVIFAGLKPEHVTALKAKVNLG